MLATSAGRRLILLLIGAISLPGCRANVPDAIALSDAIATSAMRLRQSQESTVTVDYELKLNVTSLIAIVPASGLESGALPAESSNDQRTRLEESAGMWPGQTFLAMAWSEGQSSGPAIGRHVVVRRQFSVLKPPRGNVTVVLERGADGAIAVVDLR